MARGATHVLGLDIGTQTIKLVELRLSGTEVILVGRPAVIPTPPNSVVDGRVVDEDAVSEAIRDAVADYGFGVKKVVTSVGGQSNVDVRIPELPRMDEKELEEGVRWELDRQSRFPVEEIIYDFQPVHHPGEDPQSENMEVLLVIAHEEMVNSHAETILSAKLNPIAIDAEPLALGRSLVEAGDEEFMQSTVVNVNIGHSSSLISIFCQGVPVFIRNVPTGGEALSTAIRENVQLTQEESERAKRQFADMAALATYEGEEYDEDEYEEEGEGDDLVDEDSDSVFELSAGDAEYTEELEEDGEDTDEMATRVDIDAQTYELPPDDVTRAAAADDGGAAAPREEEGEGDEEGAPAAEAEAEMDIPEDVRWACEPVSEAMLDALGELANDVRQSVQRYQNEHRDEFISKIILSGGSASMRGLAQFMEAEIGMGIPTEVSNPWTHIEVDADSISEKYLAEIGPTVSIAVGLALRNMPLTVPE